MLSAFWYFLFYLGAIWMFYHSYSDIFKALQREHIPAIPNHNDVGICMVSFSNCYTHGAISAKGLSQSIA